MGPGKYVHLPTEIEAMQVTAANLNEAAEWCGGEQDTRRGCVLVPTIDGERPAWPGWWIIRRGIPGEVYPVTADVFSSSYQAADHTAAVTLGIARMSGRTP